MNSLILLSGGLDSAVLAAALAREGAVTPLYISVGLSWEAAERATLDALLAAQPLAGRVQPVMAARFEMADVYPPTHWAVTGQAPAYDTPDDDVYLAGRNLVLLTKAGVIAAAHGMERIALGPLAGNPFPDARPEFFAAMASALSLGLAHPISVVTPFARMHKADVIRLGSQLGVPMELTLSCMQPVSAETTAVERPPDAARADLAGAASSTVQAQTLAQTQAQALPMHCGLCSKCRERRDAFADARIPDPTRYAHPEPR